MALVIHVYRFKNNKDHLHLALELTQVSNKHDEFQNYISFYAYEKSSTELRDNGKFNVNGTGTTLHRGCYNYKSHHYLKGFGFSSKHEDLQNLELIEKITLSSIQDGNNLSSRYDEYAMAKEWEAMRSGKLTTGKIIQVVNKNNKTENSATKFEVECPFDILSRHCGTIVFNALAADHLYKPRQENTNLPHYVASSLQNTIKFAKKMTDTQAEYAINNPNEFISYASLNTLYANYRATKFFLASDNAQMKQVAALLKTCDGLMHLPLDSVSKIFPADSMQNFLALDKSSRDAFSKNGELLSQLTKGHH